MDHFIFFYFVLLTLIGVALTAILIFFSFQRNNRLVDALALFYGFFTLDISLGILNKYLSVNLPELYVIFFDVVVLVNLLGRLILLWSVLFLLIQLVELKRSKTLLVGYSILLVIGFVYRGVLNKTSISSITGVQFHKIDILDVVSVLLFIFVVAVLLTMRKSIVEPEKRLLANGIILILGCSLPLIVLDTLHLFPRLIPFSSLIFLLFTLLLTLLLFKSKGFKSNKMRIEPVSGEPHGLDELDLTNREKEIMALLIEGDSDEGIANKLNTSPSIVKSHILDIFKKMCVKNRNELVSKHKSFTG